MNKMNYSLFGNTNWKRKNLVITPKMYVGGLNK